MPFQPKYTISSATTTPLSLIERTRGFLEAAQLSKDRLAKEQARALILEAHHSTYMAGTHLTLDQTRRLLAGEKLTDVDPEDIKELLNYKKAYDFGTDWVFSKGTITEDFIREIHRHLVENVRKDTHLPGQYRSIQNYVTNSKTKEILYTPPTPAEVPIFMTEFVNWLQDGHNIPPVLRASIAQFRLLHIHPFLDGNGRTARLLSTLCLYQSGYDFKRLFTLCEYYDQNRKDYYAAIQSVRNNAMDMTGWLEYFCRGLEKQAHEIYRKGSRAIQLDSLALEYELSERQKQALDSLLERDRVFSIRDYEFACPGIHRRSLQRDLADLIEKGLIIQNGIKKAAHYRVNEESIFGLAP